MISTIRECLNCEREFSSSHIGERMCIGCKKNRTGLTFEDKRRGSDQNQDKRKLPESPSALTELMAKHGNDKKRTCEAVGCTMSTLNHAIRLYGLQNIFPKRKAPPRPTRFTREELIKAMEESDGHRSKAARKLGISENLVLRELERFDLVREFPGVVHELRRQLVIARKALRFLATDQGLLAARVALDQMGGEYR
jgi:DNA-binding NtrC family response regulator